jgi:hypothetical protein
LQEHYGFTIGESTIQRIVLGHARNMFEDGRPSRDFPKTPGRHKDIIAQTDGGMIHIVEPDPDQRDKRKGKQLSRREGKISLAHAKGSRTPVYAGTIEGGVAASRMRGSGRFRVGLLRTRGRRRSSADRRPGGRAIWRSRQLLD